MAVDIGLAPGTGQPVMTSMPSVSALARGLSALLPEAGVVPEHLEGRKLLRSRYTRLLRHFNRMKETCFLLGLSEEPRTLRDFSHNQGLVETTAREVLERFMREGLVKRRKLNKRKPGPGRRPLGYSLTKRGLEELEFDLRFGARAASSILRFKQPSESSVRRALLRVAREQPLTRRDADALYELGFCEPLRELVLGMPTEWALVTSRGYRYLRAGRPGRAPGHRGKYRSRVTS